MSRRPRGAWGLQVVGVASNPARGAEVAGQWVKWFDVDAFDGRGDAMLTSHAAEALTFPSAGEAFTAWQTQSTVRPLRADGQPNRPLTAFTVAVERIA